MNSTIGIILFFCSLVYSGWASASSVAVFHALDEDLSAILKAGATKVRNFNVGTTAIQQLALDGHTIYTVRMGSGCVQTALAAQALLAKQKCELVISVGPVGDIKGNLKTGTWYLVDEVIAWQRGSHDQTGFRAHAEARIAIPKIPYVEVSDKILGKMPLLGVASGEVFIASDEFRMELASRSRCSAVDMNLFGLMSVLHSHNALGIHLRTPSDRADSSASEDFRRFSEHYIGEGGNLAAEIIRSLPKDATSPQTHEALRSLLSAPDSAESRPRIPQSGKATDGSSNPDGAPPLPAD